MITANRHGASGSGVYPPYYCTKLPSVAIISFERAIISYEDEQRGLKIKNTLILKREIMFELFKVL